MCGKGSQSTTQNTSQTSTPNAQALGLYSNILGQAQGVAATPYQPYGGELVSPVNQQQYAGIGNINSYQPAFGTALDMAYQSAQPITQQQIQQYESPYTQQVVNATQAQFNNQNAQQQQQVLGNAAAQGALGGNRVGIAQSELANQQQLAQAPVIANLQNQGYMTGLNTALTEQQAGQQGAYGVANMANAGLSGANAQIGAGTLEQQTQQAQDTAAYQQYLNQLAYPFQTTQWLAGIGTGVGSQMGGTTSGYGQTTGPSPSMLSQLTGAGTTGLGILGASGAFGSAGWLAPALAALARGGGVNGYASGGGVADGTPYPVTPEAHHTLRDQQRQLISGERHVQMFPHDTEELPVPAGMKRVTAHSGVFHYNPKHVNPHEIMRHSRNGHEHILLGLGPHSKHEILHRIANGEHPVAIVERDEHGREVRAALGTHNTAATQHAHMSRLKSKNHTVHIEHPHKVLSERMGRQTGGGVSAVPYSGGMDFIPNMGITMGRGAPASSGQAPPTPQQFMNSISGGQNQGVGTQGVKNLSQMFQGLQSKNSSGSTGGVSLAGLDPPPSSNDGGTGQLAGLDPPANGGDDDVDPFNAPGLDYDDFGEGVGDSKRGGRIHGIRGFDTGGTPGDTGVYTDPNMQLAMDPNSDPIENPPLPTPRPTAANVPTPDIAPAPVSAPSQGDLASAPSSSDNSGVAAGAPPPMPRNAPRGLRNNNPGNIEDGPFAQAQPGYAGSDGRFARFDTMDNGQNATATLLGHYGDRGVNTISSIINRWAPAADNNDTNAYIRAVSKNTGFSPNEPLDMSDPNVVHKIGNAIAAHENGIPGNYANMEARNYNRSSGYDVEQPPLSSEPTAGRGATFRGVQGVVSSPSGQGQQSGIDWSGNGNLWPALIAAGAGMMASRSPYPGVAIGEGIGAGAQTYYGMRQTQAQQEMNQQKINLEADKLSKELDFHERQLNETTLYHSQQEELKKEEIASKIQPVIGDDGQMHYVRQNTKGQLYDVNTGLPFGGNPAAVPTPPTTGGTPATPAATPGAIPNQQATFTPDASTKTAAQATQSVNTPYNYARGGDMQQVTKGSTIPEPMPIAGHSPESLKADAEYYFQTGKFPAGVVTARGSNPQAVLQNQYSTAVKNYATALAAQRGLSQEQWVDAQRSAPGMLKFLSGADGRATVSLGTAMRHLDTLHEYAQAWLKGDLGIQSLNSLRATLSRQFGSDAATNVETVSSIVGPEILKAIGIAGAGGQDDRDRVLSLFSTAKTAPQLENAIIAAQKLMGGQLEGKERQAAAEGVNHEKFVNLIGDRPYELLKQIDHGGSPGATSAQPGAAATPPARTPTAADLAYVKAHPEVADKFRKTFGQEPPQ